MCPHPSLERRSSEALDDSSSVPRELDQADRADLAFLHISLTSLAELARLDNEQG